MALVGRLAFVTGGGSGIGRATCRILAREGASVIVTDVTENKVAQTLQTITGNKQQNHLGLTLNVAEKASIENTLDSILEKYKCPPSIIVNSAGITRDNFLLKLTEEDFDQVLDVNLKGTFLVVQKFSDAIVSHGLNNGSIVNIASIVGKYGNIGQSNYCASKAGVELLTKVASKELSKFGIRVNAVLPGMIMTPMVEAVPEKVQEKFKKMIPLMRFGKPEEVGEVIAFLASDKSSYVNGASIEVTGGF